MNKLSNNSENKNITVYKLNLSNPTPAIGWENNEQDSFINRMEKKFDLVLCLGLIHHLQITERIPLVNVIQTLANFTKKNLIIEFVSNEDEKFLELAGLNIELYKNYTQKNFEEILDSNFNIIKKININNSKRVLYYVEIKQNA